MSFDLLSIYEQAQKQGIVQADSAQEQALQWLSQLGEQLVQVASLSPLKAWFSKSSILGVYLWGSVGSGKTYVMDLFYKNLPILKKGRVHFHEFMYSLHQQLREVQGEVNPMRVVAKRIAGDYQLLCLDEFIVIDIADAMILGLLLETLFDLGVVIVMTSNTVPDQLYWQGLQREQFLPAIAAIKKNMRVLEMGSGIDYRVQHDDLLRLRYLTPLYEEKTWMKERFDHIVADASVSVEPFYLQGHYLEIIARTDHVLWCTFHDLCETPRVASDYLLLMKHYRVIFLSQIPRLTALEDNAARRFIHLIDACYDQKCLVVASGETPIESIYQGARLAAEFKRTISRLIEMQTWAVW